MFLHRRKCPDLVHRGFVFTVSLQDQGRFLLLRREPGQGWPGGRGARAALGCCRGRPRSLLRWLNRSNPPHHCSVPWFALLGSWVLGAGRWGEQERRWVPQVGAVRLPAPLGWGSLRCRVPRGGAPSPPQGIPLHPGLAAQSCPSRSSLCLCLVQDALGPRPNQPHEQRCLQRPSLPATVPLVFERSVLVSFAMKQHWKDITFNHKA